MVILHTAKIAFAGDRWWYTKRAIYKGFPSRQEVCRRKPTENAAYIISAFILQQYNLKLEFSYGKSSSTS